MTDASTPNLSTAQTLKLCLYFKVGHTAFDHLKHIVRKWGLFGIQGCLAFEDSKCPDPSCPPCIKGVIQRQKLESKIWTNTPNPCGVLFHKQFLPVQHIFLSNVFPVSLAKTSMVTMVFNNATLPFVEAPSSVMLPLVVHLFITNLASPPMKLFVPFLFWEGDRPSQNEGHRS